MACSWASAAGCCCARGRCNWRRRNTKRWVGCRTSSPAARCSPHTRDGDGLLGFPCNMDSSRSHPPATNAVNTTFLDALRGLAAFYILVHHANDLLVRDYLLEMQQQGQVHSHWMRYLFL